MMIQELLKNFNYDFRSVFSAQVIREGKCVTLQGEQQFGGKGYVFLEVFALLLILRNRRKRSHFFCFIYIHTQIHMRMGHVTSLSKRSH